MNVYIYMSCMYSILYTVCRALFLNVLSSNPNIDVAMLMPSLEIIFRKTALHNYVSIYAYTHM